MYHVKEDELFEAAGTPGLKKKSFEKVSYARHATIHKYCI